MGTKGTWHRPGDADKYSAGFAAIGNRDCEGCVRGMPKRDGKHYLYGRFHSDCGNIPVCDKPTLVKVIRAIAQGRASVTSMPGEIDDWKDFPNGNAVFRCGSWTLTFFYDAGDLDYLDSASLGDKTLDLDVCDTIWHGSDGVSIEESRALEKILLDALHLRWNQ